MKLYVGMSAHGSTSKPSALIRSCASGRRRKASKFRDIRAHRVMRLGGPIDDGSIARGRQIVGDGEGRIGGDIRRIEDGKPHLARLQQIGRVRGVDDAHRFRAARRPRARAACSAFSPSAPASAAHGSTIATGALPASSREVGRRRQCRDDKPVAPQTHERLRHDEMALGRLGRRRVALADDEVAACAVRDLLQKRRGRRGEDANGNARLAAPQRAEIGDGVAQGRLAEHDDVRRHRIVGMRRRRARRQRGETQENDGLARASPGPPRAENSLAQSCASARSSPPKSRGGRNRCGNDRPASARRPSDRCSRAAARRRALRRGGHRAPRRHRRPCSAGSRRRRRPAHANRRDRRSRRRTRSSQPGSARRCGGSETGWRRPL